MTNLQSNLLLQLIQIIVKYDLPLPFFVDKLRYT